jgi:hypothetical protein
MIRFCGVVVRFLMFRRSFGSRLGVLGCRCGLDGVGG